MEDELYKEVQRLLNENRLLGEQLKGYKGAVKYWMNKVEKLENDELYKLEGIPTYYLAEEIMRRYPREGEEEDEE